MDLNITVVIATILISGAIFIPVGILIRKKIAESKIQGAEEEAKKILELANKEAENKKKEEIFKAKEEIMNARNELDQEIKERRGEIQNQEKRMFQKEENLDKRSESLEKREELIQLYTEIHKLDENTREVFYLRLNCEFSFREIGKILGKSEEWARITFYRGKIKLKEEFRKYEK